jgi:hypothetical protein
MDTRNDERREPPGNHGDWERINWGALVAVREAQLAPGLAEFIRR